MMATAVCPEPVQLRAELSLHELLTRAHEEVHVYGSAECPVCGGQLAAGESDAHCADCGARLS